MWRMASQACGKRAENTAYDRNVKWRTVCAECELTDRILLAIIRGCPRKHSCSQKEPAHHAHTFHPYYFSFHDGSVTGHAMKIISYEMIANHCLAKRNERK